MKGKIRILAMLGWLIAAGAAAGCLILFQSLQEVLAREQRLRQSTAGLENRTSHTRISNKPLVLITGDSRAAQLGEAPLGDFAVVNRGVPGQTTIEVLARIGRDMAVSRPDHVIVVAGVNDLKQGELSSEEMAAIVRSFEEMLLIGDAMGIPVTVCPIWGASSKPTLRGFALPSNLDGYVRDANLLLRAVAEEKGADIANADPLLDEKGLVRESLSSDALHLNAAGQEVLRKLLLESLDSNEGSDSD